MKFVKAIPPNGTFLVAISQRYLANLENNLERVKIAALLVDADEGVEVLRDYIRDIRRVFKDAKEYQMEMDKDWKKGKEV